MATELLGDDEATEKLEAALSRYDTDIEPLGDPARHATAEQIERALASLAAPADAGRVALIVARGTDHGRQTPSRTGLTPGQPLPGDRWDPANKHGDANQLTLMNVNVARLIANGQALTLFGDNLLTDLDLSAANLPAGGQLQVGDALLEVTAKPHTGCRQFVQRFGAAAAKLSFRADLRPRRLRGVHARVIRAGAVGVGDVVRVVYRADALAAVGATEAP